MDNNNSIPYGTITWQNNHITPQRQQRNERQARTHRQPSTSTNNNATFSFARPVLSGSLYNGPQFPSPRSRNGILSGGFDGLRNSSSASPRQGSFNNATLQQPPVSNILIPPSHTHTGGSVTHTQGYTQTATAYSNMPLLGNPSVLHRNPEIPGPMQSNLTPHSTNLLSHNTTGFQTVGLSVDSHGPHSRQCLGIISERMETAHRGVTRLKRRVTTDHGNDFLGPSSKQLLTEKMAVQMYNLRISNDYNHPSKSLPRLEQLCATRRGSSDSTRDSSHSLSTMEEEQEQERNKQTRKDIPSFVLASGVKEALKKSETILPDAIVRQINKPCLAVVPWQPFSGFSMVGTCSDKKGVINENHQDSKSRDHCVNEQIVVDLAPVLDKRNCHSTFDTCLDDDDDMDL